MKLSRSAGALMAAPAPNWRWRLWMPEAPTVQPRGSSGFSRAASSLLSGNFFSSQANRLGGDLAGAIGSEIGGTVGRFVDQFLGGGGGLGGALGPLDRILAESVDFNHVNIGTTSRFGGGKHTHYPDMATVDASSITFYEDVNYTVTRYLYQWRRSIYSEDGNFGAPADYKRDIYLECFNLTDDFSPVLRGTLKGCWPTTQNPLALNYNDEGRVTVQCQFSVDNSSIS